MVAPERRRRRPAIRRALTGSVLAGLAVVAGLAPATAVAAGPAHTANAHKPGKAHKPARCPRGQARHAGKCQPKLRVPAHPQAKQPSLLPIVRLQALSAPRRGSRHHVAAAMDRAALKRVGGLDALAAATGRVPAKLTASAARALARAADAGGIPLSAGGWTGTATGDVPLHDDATGTDVTVHVDADGKDGSTAKSTEVNKTLVDNCPDASGRVPGTAERTWSVRLDVPGAQPGWSVEVNFSYGATFTVEGHTSPDGTLHDWEQTMKFLAHVQFAVLHHGRVVETNAPTVWTTHISADITPGERLPTPSALADNMRGPGLFTFLGNTYVERSSADGLGHLFALADFLWRVGTDDIRQRFDDAKTRHWDTGDCVKVALSAAKQQLAPSESVPVTEALTGAAGKGVAPARLTARVDDGAVVTPTSTDADAAPFRFTAIAPSSFDAGDTFTMTVNAVSKQGRGSATITFSALPRTQLYFEVKAVSGSMDYEATYPRNQYSGDTCMITGSEKYALTTSSQPAQGSGDDSGVFLMAPSHLHGSQDYSDPCAFPSTQDDPCQTTLDDESDLLVSISHTTGAATGTAQISAVGRDVPADSYCHDRFGDDWVAGDDSVLTQTVAWSKLTGSQPFTLTGSDHVTDGERTVTRQVSITLQPVDQYGNPLR